MVPTCGAGRAGRIYPSTICRSYPGETTATTVSLGRRGRQD